MVNFSKLTDPSRLNVSPKKITIKTVPKAGTVADVFKTFSIPQNQMAELALLNNMELTDKVKPGKLIKLIGE